ncbi:phosphotransferase [Mycetocola manganoxydans]|uniref:Maltokinase n=1 Tax=Mycetocola manganoxydans TaxID=699879 RepID=A0A3L6ZYX5_9MICO|nr:phosphotransferase [Mycetocola manganoxydans]RLP72362.1 phosphotransferase [Mycetocola manganoxydans]GHD40746.1 trehalose biosynthesis protein [Mycetocola manganoxydans]
MSPLTSHLDLIAPWLGSQRWFASKGHLPELELLGSWQIPAADCRVLTHLIMDHSATVPVLYQVPVTEHRSPLTDGDAALIGTFPDGDDTVYLYDGPQDPVYAEALLRMIVSGATAIPEGADAVGRSFGDMEISAIDAARVLRGEQSNTSIIYKVTTPNGPLRVICKVFRALHHGENPDVVLQSAIAAAGSDSVPHSIGYIEGGWSDIGQPGGLAHGHLAFAQEFLAGAEDAWRIALRASEDGVDFTAEAHALGTTTAEVHRTLAASFGTKTPSDSDVAETLDSFSARLQLAIDEVPAIAELRGVIEDLYSTVRTLEWPALHRIHGDYHLGQVLVADGHWILIDFEGEPMRPMIERSRPDFAVRDVAGMLRSFDYVAGSLGSTEQAAAWTSAARRAFLSGYIEESGIDLRAHRELLDAFEMDKAVYEAVYEARNRPDWLPIPLAALRRLAARAR